MSDKRRDQPQAEAAAWHARLSRHAITTDTLRAFRQWRGDPRNAAAYQHVEATWARAGALAGDPDIQAATLAALDRRPRRITAAKAWPAAAGLAAAGTLAATALLLLPPYLQPLYATGVGEQRLVVLKDGSRVRLNTDSRIALRFTRGERRILLSRGEAYFEAAHDTRRPFVVDAGQASVRALGTRFDVRREGDQVAVVLVQGSVRVTPSAAPAAARRLTPDQRLTATDRSTTAPAPVDAAQAVSWTSGRLVFHETPLAAAVAEVNRYSTRKIVLAVPSLAEARVNGAFETGDTEAFAAGVSDLFGLRATPTDGGGLRLERPAA